MGDDFKGELTPMAIKRLTREKDRFFAEASELEEMGIFFHWNELSRAKALIIGPEETPYEHGFFFYDIHFPDNYPIRPPRVKFCTGDGRVRFNPNLYVDGKVCLSILGTWNGPSWTSSCTLRTVLLSIQSLLQSHPIQNEPGHEKEVGSFSDNLYSEIIAYETVNVGVVRMLEKTPKDFGMFEDAMRNVFLRCYDAYCKTAARYAEKEGNSVRSPIWSFRSVYQSTRLLGDLKRLKSTMEKGALAASSLNTVESATNAHGTENKATSFWQ
eukprot:GEMP01023136.1.p1 GENE.GEMP01023136.1~~GEMP01023136.1.p1  ORF type:complete len:285 (+),score=49.54 GEMP01023136.1:46-855(+)